MILKPEDRITYGLYRLIWLILDSDAKFISIHTTADNMLRYVGVPKEKIRSAGFKWQNLNL